MTQNVNQLTFSEHFKELKKRIIICIIAFLGGFLLCLNYSDIFMEFLFKIGKESGYEFVYLSPQEILIQQFKISGFFGIFCAFPIISYQILKFISPAFEVKNTSLKIMFIEIISIIMFFIGVLFAYKILLPFTFSYLYKIGESINVKAQVSVENYISLFLTLITCLGFVFEIPLISVLLTKIGLLNAEIMKKGRNIAIIVIFIIAAIITPPDVVSQCIVAVPMVFLYQISIILCKICKK